MNNPNLNWWKSSISLNPNITYHDIMNNPNLNWKNEIQGISGQNSNSGWNWNHLSINKNILWSKYDKLDYIKKSIAARFIQKIFLKAYYDPEYKICKDRLLREFNLL